MEKTAQENESYEEQLKRNPFWFALTMIALGGMGGFGLNAALNGSALFSGNAPKVDWQAEAKNNGWMEASACPALPVALRVLSPGNGAIIEFRSDSLRTDLVIASSQSLPKTNSVGFIVNPEGDTNFYVVFRYFSENDQRRLFRDERFVQIPFKVEKPTHIDLWGIVIDDKNRLGPVYSKLEDIKAVSNAIFMSDKISFTAIPAK